MVHLTEDKFSKGILGQPQPRPKECREALRRTARPLFAIEVEFPLVLLLLGGVGVGPMDDELVNEDSDPFGTGSG